MARASKKPGRRGAPTLHANVAQLRALAHPLRLRILELFAEMPRTTMQVAELLGQPHTRLYHHVNALERAGLLCLRETRAKRGTVEKWYEAAAQRLDLKKRAHSSRGRSAARPPSGLAIAVLEQARREMTAALSEPDEAPLLMRLVAVGTPARIAAIRRRLRALVKELASEGKKKAASSSRRTNVERWAITLAYAPVRPRAIAPDASASARSGAPKTRE